jgi:AraC family transcriptional regulator, regulatory protein of adaptative response / DNA-3-methyladenine glycosylase II
MLIATLVALSEGSRRRSRIGNRATKRRVLHWLPVPCSTSENRETSRPPCAIVRCMEMDDDACYRAIATRDSRFDGLLFVAVRTTAIYCRPICPAPLPRRDQVCFYPTAAACQEAGFRPCLRCRPESAPELGAWLGTRSTVSRALGLIEDGALDASSVDALASRLGVGERQLRRLFQQHLGASPIAVAQTRRILLAKQLIHDTQLPMIQVALAAGFRSVRRFNETFRQLFGHPPSALRRSAAIEELVGRSGAIRFTLSYRPPFEWDELLTFLRARAITGVEAVSASRYMRTISVGDTAGAIVVEPEKSARLAIIIRYPDLRALPIIIARVRRVFDLAADPVAIGEHLSCDPLLAPLVAARPGLRVPGAWDGFELAVRAILGQQITVSAAAKLAERLVAACGQPIGDPATREYGLTHVFPTPQQVAAADLTVLGMPKARRAALSSLAAAVVADPMLFSPRSDLETAIECLRQLPGIGEWTAQYIAMRQLREPDAFPVADIGIARALSARTGERPTPAELLARAEPWRPWRAYAAMHLWASEPRHTGFKGDPRNDRQHARTPAAGPPPDADRGSSRHHG